MISEAFRLEFKNLLGENYQYTPKIKALLKTRKVYNRNNKHFSSVSIRKVFTGNAENTAIELALYDFFEKEKQRNQQLEQRRNKYRDR